MKRTTPRRELASAVCRLSSSFIRILLKLIKEISLVPFSLSGWMLKGKQQLRLRSRDTRIIIGFWGKVLAAIQAHDRDGMMLYGIRDEGGLMSTKTRLFTVVLHHSSSRSPLPIRHLMKFCLITLLNYCK